MINLEKTVSANSKGVVISYRDSNKHMFTAYANTYVQRIQMEGTTKFQKAEIINYFTPLQKEMYSKVVYGFAAYTNEELNEMSPTVKSVVNEVPGVVSATNPVVASKLILPGKYCSEK